MERCALINEHKTPENVCFQAFFMLFNPLQHVIKEYLRPKGMSRQTEAGKAYTG